MVRRVGDAFNSEKKIGLKDDTKLFLMNERGEDEVWRFAEKINLENKERGLFQSIITFKNGMSLITNPHLLTNSKSKILD